MVRWLSVLLVSLYVVLFELRPFLISAQAQETSDVVESEESDGGDDAATENAPDSFDRVQDNLDKLANLASSSDQVMELKQKLSLLKGLLEKKSGDEYVALKAKLDSVSKTLGNIDFSHLDRAAEIGASENPVEELLAACTTMAIKHAGPRQSATFAAMKRMASGTLTAKEASEIPLMRMLAVCVHGLSQEEFKQFKAGKFDELPKPLQERAAGQSAKADVLALETEIPGIWAQMVKISSPLYETMKEAASKEGGLPVQYKYSSFIAAIVLVLGMAFLGKKFLDMQRDQREMLEKKKEKALKKKGK